MDMEHSTEAPKPKIKEQDGPASTATKTTTSQPPMESPQNEAVIASATPSEIRTTPKGTAAVAATAKSATTTSTATATETTIKSVPSTTSAPVSGATEKEEEALAKKWPEDVMVKLKGALARRIKDTFYVRSLCKEMVCSQSF